MVGHFGLGRWVISANFQSESFRSLVVWPKSESDNYMCMHYYMCMNGQMGR